MKWCWARLPGGVVSWETYKMFKIGEKGQFGSIVALIRLTSDRIKIRPRIVPNFHPSQRGFKSSAENHLRFL